MGTMPPEVASVFDLISLIQNPDAFKAKLKTFADAQTAFEKAKGEQLEANRQAAIDREQAETLNTKNVENAEANAALTKKLETDRASLLADQQKHLASVQTASAEFAAREQDVKQREVFVEAKAKALDAREKTITERDEVLRSREAANAAATKELQEKLAKLKALAA